MEQQPWEGHKIVGASLCELERRMFAAVRRLQNEGKPYLAADTYLLWKNWASKNFDYWPDPLYSWD